MSIVIYHNPKCTKSRQTLELLNENGIKPEIVEYLKNVPNKADLKKIISALGFSSPRDLMRKDNNLDDDLLTDDQLIDAMIRHPKIIERPIVVNGIKAAIGRPPENILKII
jgi:arsenate reductase